MDSHDDSDHTITNPKMNTEMKAFLGSLGQPCSSMLKRCTLAGEEVDCSKIFVQSINDFGQCCNFNVLPEVIVMHGGGQSHDINSGDGDTHWDPQTGYPGPPEPGKVEEPYRTTHSGLHHGLSVTLDLQVS